MSKNTMFYGLLAVGGLLAYYAWKKNSEKNKALKTSTSGTFVDDISVLESKPITTTATELVEDLKKSVSIISEPIINNNEMFNQEVQLV
jgi:hypothetical protein